MVGRRVSGPGSVTFQTDSAIDTHAGIGVYDLRPGRIEQTGSPLELYDTPAKKMGQLSYQMWRAARLVPRPASFRRARPRVRAKCCSKAR